MRTLLTFLLLTLFSLIASYTVPGQSTAITYNGTFTDGGSPANGSYDFQYTLFDAASGGAQIGSTLQQSNITVSGGAFSATLDFGPNAFTGPPRYLEVGIRHAGVGGYILQSPRTLLAGAPYAIRALTVTGPIVNPTPGIANPSPSNLPPAALTGHETATNDSTAGLIGISDSTNGFGILGIADTTDASGLATAIAGLAPGTTGRTRGVSGLVFSPDGIAVSAASSNGGNLFVGANNSGPGNVFVVDAGGNVTTSGVISGGTFADQSGHFSVDAHGAITAGDNGGFTVDKAGAVLADVITGRQLKNQAATFSVDETGAVSAGSGFFLHSLTAQDLTLQGPNGLTTNKLIVSTSGATIAGGLHADTLTVTGAKNNVVRLNDGRSVLLYAMESPEYWFEDFGTLQLHNGHAVITIDPTYAQTVNLDVPYKVFLTPDGNCRGLYVFRKSKTSFEVRELRGGHSNISFDYRIVAKRLNYEKVRLNEYKTPANGQR